ncbi:formate dehydrogenase accessory sulfurtransferase FdhD [Celeribacter marinus]|uniref:Sulfur carrier protein FdhD n=1 Tax=Celeribacter marinus TaxID=1397108 RepID=A0A0N9ZI57_9RHOB|nr:formate dehydrogenase accessory sulfurtransferase FdhD [Celeribacter marinus]ALI56694.1 formate dehydrogenase chain D [Celeribacter marinus]SFK63194.1 FdhD protein [Celeribacter marinus]
MSAPTDNLPDEVAVALVLNGSTVAVLMSTPHDLTDLLRGFAVSEGIVERGADVTECEVHEYDEGIEVRGRIAQERASALDARRRASVGPVGCGLCGIESLTAATAKPPHVPPAAPTLFKAVRVSLAALNAQQVMHQQSRAMHAAAVFTAHGLQMVREDVGRHNALDKLIGTFADTPMQNAGILMTSRLSIDLVQKCARAGLSALFSVSRPTKAAVELAREIGMTLGVVTPSDIIFYAGAPKEADQ